MVCPRIGEKLRKIADKSRECTPLHSGQDVFEVDDSLRTHIVWQTTGRCDCDQWQVSGIPCKYVVSALSYKRVDPETVVLSCCNVQEGV